MRGLDMASVAERLLSLKEEMETARTKKAQYEGRLQELMTRLKEEFDCTTVKQARKVLKELTEQGEDLRSELEDGLEALEERLAE